MFNKDNIFYFIVQHGPVSFNFRLLKQKKNYHEQKKILICFKIFP